MVVEGSFVWVCVMHPQVNVRLGRFARCYILLVLAVVLAPGVVSQIKFITKKKKTDAGPRTCTESDGCRRQTPLSYQGNPGEPRIIVVFPDNHRSGGPAHFHQVHSGLNRLGFLSLMHHVNPYYADEHMKNLSKMLTPDEISSRDVLILPCNWEGGVVDVSPEDVKRVLLPAVEGRLTSSRCSSNAYNSVCQDVCVF